MRGRVRACLAAVLLVAAPVTAGSIRGTIHYDGAEPPSRALKMDADPACVEKHSSPVMTETIVLGEGGDTLANVFVHVKSGLPKKDYPVPSEPVVLDQRGCRYTPHVLGVMVGQKFKVLNSDGLLHSVHALPSVNSSFNRAMPAHVKEAEYTFSKEEFMFKIKCDVHPWMGAWVAVMPHPFFAVSDSKGQFKIEGLPAGTYEIEAWHEFERLPAQTASMTVGDGDQNVDFTFGLPAAEPR